MFLAEILFILKKSQATIDLLKNLEISNEHDKSLKFNFIGIAYMNQGKLNESIEYYQKSLEIRLKTVGEDHPDTADSYNNIGIAYMNQGKFNEAIEYYEKSLEIQLKT